MGGGTLAQRPRAPSGALDAACLIAVQEPLAAAAAFQRLAPVLELVDIPELPNPQRALAAIAEHRLRLHDLEVPIDDLISSDALDALVGFYNEANRSLRLTLAALRTGSPPRPVPTIG